MICPKHNTKMILLFTSYACDVCDGKVSPGKWSFLSDILCPGKDLEAVSIPDKFRQPDAFDNNFVEWVTLMKNEVDYVVYRNTPNGLFPPGCWKSLRNAGDGTWPESLAYFKLTDEQAKLMAAGDYSLVLDIPGCVFKQHAAYFKIKGQK